MDKEEKELFMSIDRKLSAIISLLLQKECPSVKQKVIALSNTPLSNKESADIIGISDKHFGKEKSLAKNRKERELKFEEAPNDKQAGDEGLAAKE